MKKILLTITAAVALSMNAAAQEKLFMGASNQSPVVHEDGTVTFTLHAPKAVKVEVTGDFLPEQPGSPWRMVERYVSAKLCR